MTKLTMILASLLLVSSASVLAKKPELSRKPAIAKKVNPIREQCIKPFLEQSSKLRADRKLKSKEIISSFRKGEISEADLEAELQKIAVEAAAAMASLVAQKEACIAPLQKVE